MINEQNFSRHTMKRVTEILGYGMKVKIMADLNIDKQTMDNVWRGRKYIKGVVDAIVNEYKKKLQDHLLNHITQ